MNGDVIFMELDADGLMFNDVVVGEQIVGKEGVRDGMVDESKRPAPPVGPGRSRRTEEKLGKSLNLE